jgi:hypothetical protein
MSSAAAGVMSRIATMPVWMTVSRTATSSILPRNFQN